MKKLILLLLLIATPCLSQEMKDVKKRRVFDKKFWLATAFVVGTTILDSETTARCKRGNGCSEVNPLFGRNPGRAKIYGVKAPFAGIVVLSTWWWKRDDMRRMERYIHRNELFAPEPRVWQKPRESWYLPALAIGGMFGAAGIHNLAAGPKQPGTPAQPIRLPGTPNQP